MIVFLNGWSFAAKGGQASTMCLAESKQMWACSRLAAALYISAPGSPSIKSHRAMADARVVLPAFLGTSK